MKLNFFHHRPDMIRELPNSAEQEPEKRITLTLDEEGLPTLSIDRFKQLFDELLSDIGWEDAHEANKISWGEIHNHHLNLNDQEASALRVSMKPTSHNYPIIYLWIRLDADDIGSQLSKRIITPEVRSIEVALPRDFFVTFRGTLKDPSKQAADTFSLTPAGQKEAAELITENHHRWQL